MLIILLLRSSRSVGRLSPLKVLYSLLRSLTMKVDEASIETNEFLAMDIDVSRQLLLM